MTGLGAAAVFALTAASAVGALFMASAAEKASRQVSREERRGGHPRRPSRLAGTKLRLVLLCGAISMSLFIVALSGVLIISPHPDTGTRSWVSPGPAAAGRHRAPAAIGAASGAAWKSASASAGARSPTDPSDRR